jgi:hypothetical protein
MNAGRHIPTHNRAERILRSLLAAALVTAVAWALTGNASPTTLFAGLW